MTRTRRQTAATTVTTAAAVIVKAPPGRHNGIPPGGNAGTGKAASRAATRAVTLISLLTGQAIAPYGSTVIAMCKLIIFESLLSRDAVNRFLPASAPHLALRHGFR
jgi:hypothetical protein